MHFGLFIKQEWFSTNPNYTWSVDNGLSVEGKIWWLIGSHSAEDPQAHVRIPFQGCSCHHCHCTDLERLSYIESQAPHKERQDGASPQRGNTLVLWVQRWNNKDDDWAQGGGESSIGATFLLTLMDRLQGGVTSLLKEDEKQQIQQSKKVANKDNNHHVRGG